MTKKDFKDRADIHKYGKRSDGVIAVYFDWKTGDNCNGYKYCIFARQLNSTQTELLNMLKDFIEGKIEDTPWWIQLVVAPTDEQRFKVPISSGGLNRLIKYEV